MSLSNIGLQSLIHIGTECVILGAFAFWMNKRTSSLENTVGDLNKKIGALETIIERQQQYIMHHESILRQIVDVQPNQSAVPDSRQHFSGHPPPIPRPPQPPVPQGHSSSPHPRPNPLPPNQPPARAPLPPPPLPPSPPEEPEVPPDVLDKILDEELGKMEPTDTEMEIEISVPKMTKTIKKRSKITEGKKKAVTHGNQKVPTR